MMNSFVEIDVFDPGLRRYECIAPRRPRGCDGGIMSMGWVPGGLSDDTEAMLNPHIITLLEPKARKLLRELKKIQN